MNNVVSIRPIPERAFTVKVIYDAECRMWVASCPDLHVFTEAPSFEALTARVWEVAPEMAQENGLQVQPEDLRLHFAFDQGFADHRMAL